MAYAFTTNYMYIFINAAINGNWRVMLATVVVVYKVTLSSAACADLPVYNSGELSVCILSGKLNSIPLREMPMLLVLIPHVRHFPSAGFRLI